MKVSESSFNIAIRVVQFNKGSVRRWIRDILVNKFTLIGILSK